MSMSSPGFHRTLRSIEKHLADQAARREDNFIAEHLAAVNASLGKPSKRRQARTEPMPYFRRIVVAFTVLAGALATLSWWCP